MNDVTRLPALDAALTEGEAVAVCRDLSFRADLNVAGHAMVADEPVAVGGTDQGPSPYGLLSSALAACTAITLQSYARIKQLQLAAVRVYVRHRKVHREDCEHCESRSAMIDRFERYIALEGALTDEQRKRLLEIADRCPVHRTLTAGATIVTQALAADA
ncbi:MAG TPA: OsmC family protein [Mizugakiibacter sp.]